MRHTILALLFILVTSVAFYSCKQSGSTGGSNPANKDAAKSDSAANDTSLAHEFAFEGLKTDFKIHSIPLDSIHEGGPDKNGIPAIDFPEFIPVHEAKGFLTEPDYGILLEGKTETKFYPFNILNWHEIVNDNIDGIPVAVTFCPLCGTGIVYERMVKGDTLDFGVSGRLYESNLLMFDNKNESLWSQSMGAAVAGAYTGEKLKLVNSTVASFEDVLDHFPAALVLSPKTGFDRNYTQYPYADYMSSEELYFPVSKTSSRFPAKEMMYVVPVGNTSVAFHWIPLLKKGSVTVSTPDGPLTVKMKNNIPSATLDNNKIQPGYFSFWFSWYTTYGERGIVWDSK